MAFSTRYTSNGTKTATGGRCKGACNGPARHICPEVQVAPAHGLTTAAQLPHAAFSSAVPTAPVRPLAGRKQMRVEATAQPLESTSRRAVLGTGLTLAAATAAPLSMPGAALANKVLSSDWEQVDLPVEKGVVLLDIGFTGTDPDHGFLLGTRQTLLETFDGGKTWAPREVEAARDEGFNYRFQSISFNGSEGWIVGKPAILLHTTDSGKNWERIPLSSKLPGAPLLIAALQGNKQGQAELATDQGAIYVTDNAAYTWSAAVQETVDATLNRTVSSGISGASYYEGSFSNISRSPTGEYAAVSSRGNFYLTWVPGQSYWQPHNRPVARRVQNMGWTPSNALWLTTRGGDVLLNGEPGVVEKFQTTKLASRGFGVLDVGFLNDNVAYACGGSGSLFKSTDGGVTWKRDKSTDNVAGNLYSIKFFPGSSSAKNGFILGNDGILLKFIGQA